MTLTPEQVDVMLADFAMQNDSLLAKTQQERPAVHDAVMNLLTILSKKFGTQAYVTTPAPQSVPDDSIPKVGDRFFQKEDELKRIWEIEKIENGNYQFKRLDDGWIDVSPLEPIKYSFKVGRLIKVKDKATPAPQPVAAPKPAPVRRKVQVQPEQIVQVTPVQPEPVEELTEQELKEAIDSLKPIAAFDDEVKQELNALKIRLKALKQKKS